MKVLTSTLFSIALCTGLQAQTFELSSQEETSLLSFQGSVFHTTNDEVRNLRQVDVGGSSVVLLLWEEFEAQRELTTSHYAISLDSRSVAVSKPADYALLFEHGAFDPLAEGPRPIDKRLVSPKDSNVYVVQFVTQPLEVFLNRLESLGARVHAYVADYGYAVQMDP